MTPVAIRSVPWCLRAPQQAFLAQIFRFILMSTWILLLLLVILKESKDSNLTRNLSDCWENSTDLHSDFASTSLSKCLIDRLYSDSNLTRNLSDCWENSTDLYSDFVSITSLSKCLIDRLNSGWLERFFQGRAWRELYIIMLIWAGGIRIRIPAYYEKRSRGIGWHRFQVEPDYVVDICDIIAHVSIALVAWVAVLMQGRSTDEDRTVEIHLDSEAYIDVASAASTRRTRRAVEEQVHPEILARGLFSPESHEKTHASDKMCITAVPIMLIGQHRAGKTSLKKSLKGMSFDPEEDSTVGIDVDPSRFEVTTETWRTASEEQDADATLWDFSGQSVYYDMHPLFLTAKAIYCLVYDLSLNPRGLATPVWKQGVYKKYQQNLNLKTNLHHLDFWMRSVASMTRRVPESMNSTANENKVQSQTLPPVFLVCTHADTPYDENRKPTEIAHEVFGYLKSKPYGTHLLDVFVVDNTKSGSWSECPGVIRLRKEIHDVVKELASTNKHIPMRWLKFLKSLTELKCKDNHFVSLETAKYAAKCCGIVDDAEFKAVVRYLHDLRILIHFDDTQGLNELLVLDVPCLIDLVKNVVTVKRYDQMEKKFVGLWLKLQKEGVVDEELLAHVLGTLGKNEVFSKGVITSMEQFGLLCPSPSLEPKGYLVPSMLKRCSSSKIIMLVSSTQIPSLFVKFEAVKVPPGLFHRFVVQFFRWGKGKFLRPAEPQLFQNFARLITSGDKICSVIFVCQTSTVEVAIYAEDQAKATANACASVVCRQLGVMLESIRKECFWLRNMRYEMAVLCPVCCRGGALEDYCYSHDLEGCKEEQCLHFWSLSELCSAKKPIICTKPGLKKDVVVDVEKFSPWLPPSGQQHVHRESGVRGLSTDEALSVLSDVNDGPIRTSRNARQLGGNLHCIQGALDIPDVETKGLTLRFTREAECLNRLDVVQDVREVTPAGTTVVCVKELNVNAEFKTDVHPGAVAAVGTGSQVNLGNLLDATVRPQVTAGQSSYDISVSGGNAVIGDNSELNVGTGGPSSEQQEHEDNRDNRVEDVD
ncbi:uncharacterized protein [Montipora foliosa]|uniref:uncharacterized protein isoform X2 n=1 Tax=Montipora foliosa TaxID=591990 RepID=UPI0035F12129